MEHVPFICWGSCGFSPETVLGWQGSQASLAGLGYSEKPGGYPEDFTPYQNLKPEKTKQTLVNWLVIDNLRAKVYKSHETSTYAKEKSTGWMRFGIDPFPSNSVRHALGKNWDSTRFARFLLKTRCTCRQYGRETRVGSLCCHPAVGHLGPSTTTSGPLVLWPQL